MKKLNLYGVFDLGKAVGSVGEIAWNTPVSSVMIKLWELRSALQSAARPESPYLDVTKRAAGAVVDAINVVLPTTFEEVSNINRDEELAYKGYRISETIKAFESVLSNEMPSVPAYIVSQKGIYRTEDLIDRSDQHFPAAITLALPVQAREDLCQAGKCLAFELPTACSFHLWRSLETVIDAYYSQLTSSDFATDKVSLNWGAKIKALEEKGADKAITKYLDHIRDQYRNPQTHPEEMVELDEALMLFGTAASSITQMMMAIKELIAAKKPALVGPTLGNLLAGASLLDQVSPEQSS